MICCIIPAHNEESTVGDVVRAVVDSRAFDVVLCVDDGSSDATAERASAAGVPVLQLSPNRGKGEAMVAGIEALGARRHAGVGFVDADLMGLEPHHVSAMRRGFDYGFDQSIALKDWGARNPLNLRTPLISGQRIVSQKVLAGVPRDCFRGYGIETGINDASDRAGGRVFLTVMRGVRGRSKREKSGLWTGLRGDVRMHWQLGTVARALRRSCGTSCSL